MTSRKRLYTHALQKQKRKLNDAKFTELTRHIDQTFAKQLARFCLQKRISLKSSQG